MNTLSPSHSSFRPTGIKGHINSSIRAVLLLIAPLLFLQSGNLIADDESRQPKLILQITVDALRGDLPTRYYERLGEGGLRYLYESGIVYKDAHHAHANTETIVGHATLATGAHPSSHGMVGNIWFDQSKGTTVYNIEDADYPLLTQGAGVNQDTEIDPTQRAATVQGRSPRSILASTFSDELSLKTFGKAKVFGVSVKDRGAVSLAGHAGKAYWFSKQSGDFVTSSYYMNEYPAWVTSWNNQNISAKYGDTNWELMHNKSTYLFGDFDDNDWELDLAGFKNTFPHPYGSADGKYFTTLLTVSPAGDAITLDFAKALVLAEDIGQDTITDYLSISLSSNDYVCHLFGPSSLEAEDQMLRLDQTLAELFSFIDDKVGLENTLIVFSADHGSPETPGYNKHFGLDSDYVDPKSWDRTPAIESLKSKFGIGEALIEVYNHPYLNLNKKVITKAGLDPIEVEQEMAKVLRMFPGVAAAVPSSSLLNAILPDTAMNRAILKNYHPKRSGDIYLVFEPRHFINDFDGLIVASVHGHPYNYDSYVPIIFAGMGLKPKTVHRRIYTTSIASTLAAVAETNLPSGTEGEMLAEVLGD